MKFSIEKLVRLLGKLQWVIAPYLPGTSLNTILRTLDRQGAEVLDVGGGWGETMAFLNKKHNWQRKVNADIFLPHLRDSQLKRIYDEYILCDARYLPFKEKSFDIVLCLEVIEHMPKEEGLKLLSDLERIARKQVILTAPVGEKIHPEPQKIKTFPWGHFPSWRPAELGKVGYRVRGDGFPCVKGYLLTASPSWLIMLLGYLLYPIASPVVHFFPNKAGGMTGIKQINGDS